MARASLIVLIVSVAAFMVGCDSPAEPDPNDLEPTLSSIQQNVFTPTCATAGCHAAPQAQEGLVLSAGQSRANLVNVASNQVPGLMRVAPGNPNDSYLIIKLEGTDRMAPNTARMPELAPPLSQQTINVIRQWISDGAPNN